MSDAATNFLSELTASKDKASAAQTLLTKFRAGASGVISQGDFQTIFAEMELEQPKASAAKSTSSIQSTTFDVKRTIFECQLYPSFSNNYATAKYEAGEMIKALDANGDGAVSLVELESYNPDGGTTSSVTASQISALSPAEIASLAPSEIGSLTTSAIGALSSTQIAALTTDQVGALTSTQIGALTSDQIGAMTPTQLGAITTSSVNGLNASDISKLSVTQFSGFNGDQIAALTTDAIAGLTGEEISSLTTNEVSALPSVSISALSSAQISKLTTDAISALNSTQISAIGPTAIVGLTSMQLNALSSAQMGALADSSVGALTTSQLGALTPSQLSSISNSGLGQLTADDVSALTAEQLAALDISQRQALGNPRPTFNAMPLTMMASVAETVAATNFANTALKTFDVSSKGYFTLADMQDAYAKNSSLGDPTTVPSDFAQFDANSDGQVSQQELVSGYQQMDIASNLSADFDPNNAGYLNLSVLTPQINAASPSLGNLLKSWDTDNNSQLTNSEIITGIQKSTMSLSELSALVESVNVSISSEKTMAQYDTTNKGYITSTDLSTAWASANSTNDPATADSAISAWDQNSDGQVNLGEMISGQQVTDLASQLLSQFDPAMNGYIDVSSAGASAFAAAPSLFNLLKSWDADDNGQVTQLEIMNGIKASNAKSQLDATQKNTSAGTDAASQAVSIMSQVDTNFDGQINLDEFLNYAGSQASIGADPISTFNAWDTNNDGYLTLDEIQTGIQTIQQAQSIVKQYDTNSKGYFDINDMETALSSSDTTSTSSDIAAQAQQIMNFWDSNGDGKVTVQEVIKGIKAGGYVGGQQLSTTATVSSSSPSSTAST